MSYSARSPAIPPYSLKLFVNRDEEIVWLQELVQHWIDGHDLLAKIIEYWGPRGSGKSWYLLHLAQERYLPPNHPSGETGKQLAVDDRVRSLHLDLRHFSASGQPPEQGTRKFIEAFNQHLGAWLGRPATNAQSEEPSLYELSAWLREDVRDLNESACLILLLDHVSEQPEDFLRELERRVLAPLIRLPGVLMVMAKRGKGYPWREGALRWNLRDCDLGFFDRESTTEQLQRLGFSDRDHPQTVWEQSRGCPLLNNFLPQENGLRKAVDALLARVSPQDRSLLEATCVLRLFHEDHFPTMLAAYHDDPVYCNLGEAESREQLHRILNLDLGRWDNRLGGFVLDAVVRPLLEQWLLQTDRERWRRLQCEAYTLYIYFQLRYPEDSNRWIAEAAYHREQLERAGFLIQECLRSLCYEQRFGGGVSTPPASEPDDERVADRPVPSTQPNLGAIHALLARAFTAPDLRRFCRDHSDFYPIYRRINPSSDLESMIDEVIDYCETGPWFSELLTDVRTAKPRVYEEYAPYLYGDRRLPESLAGS